MFDGGNQRRRREIVHRSKGAVAVLVALTILVGGGYLAFDKVREATAGIFLETVEDYTGDGESAIEVEIPKGSSVAKMGDILLDKDVIASTEAWSAATAKAGDETATIQAGIYGLRTKMPAEAALGVLLDPKNLIVRRFTVPEGLRLTEILPILAKGTGIKQSEFEKALKNPDKLGIPSWAKEKPEGFLYPDTYEYTKKSTATSILQMMVKRNDQVLDDMDYKDRAKELGLTRYELVTVASIIEKEVFADKDRPKVARVIYNRLDQGMRLQFDSTAYYGTNSTPKTAPPNLTSDVNPYNTYVVDGLPAGPISNPGKAALEAAAEPADGNWLYFVTVNFKTGETKFTDSHAEHEKNVAEWKSWCKKNDNPSGCPQ